jgi:hypothetical protein
MIRNVNVVARLSRKRNAKAEAMLAFCVGQNAE